MLDSVHAYDSRISNNSYLVCLSVGMSNCRNADRLDWQACHAAKAIVSRIARVGIAAKYCHFRWPAFRSVGIKAVTGCTCECWHSARSFSFSTPAIPPTGKLAWVFSNRPKRSNRSGHSPTVELGRFATPTSRAFHICIGLNGVRRRCAR